MLNTLFAGVDQEQLKLISQCGTTNNAQDTLQTIHEGNDKVRITRLQTLTSKFEGLRMREDENVELFNNIA